MKIVSLEDNKTKEPQEVLIQDFMRVTAIFSGKAYSLRSYDNQNKLLEKAGEYIEHKQ